MDAGPLSLPRLRCLRRLASALCASAPLLGGCAQPMHQLLQYGPRSDPSPPVVTTSAVAAPPTAEVVLVGHTTAPAPLLPVGKELPITLDTVLRLAEAHNARIAVARERLNESVLSNEAAAGCWLPQTYAGVAYYRHEGGIQNEDGTLTHSSTGALYPGLQLRTEFDVREATFRRVDAERQVWQNKGELSRVSNEVLLEAATTYIDLLTARRAEGVTRELARSERDLLERAERLAKSDRSATALVEGVRSALVNSDVTISRLRQQGNAASAKLGYLLGLPSALCLVPVDAALVPIDLVDANPPTEQLVALALANGPGVHELEGLLGVIQGGIAEASSLKSLLPSVQLNVFEGPFGAGIGSSLSWDNRLDIGLQARWNLTQLATARQQRRIAESKLHQVQLSYLDLRGKLTAGVEEARDAILNNREQIGLAAGQIRHASEGYRLSDRRLREGVPGGSISEVLQTIGTLGGAHSNYIRAIADYNKAQVRLLLLLGPTPAPHGHPTPGASELPPPA
jgi:outer membrane protein TolC